MHRFFYRAWPGDWADQLAALVLVHGWSRADAFALDDVELSFWASQAIRLAAARDDA